MKHPIPWLALALAGLAVAFAVAGPVSAAPARELRLAYTSQSLGEIDPCG